MEDRQITYSVRSLREDERPWLAETLDARWGGIVVSRGVVHHPATLPAIVCLHEEERVGVATYEVCGDECELVTIDAFTPGQGAGFVLLHAVQRAAREQGCRRLWLVTTNDNTRALRFYQRHEMVLAALHRDALAESRRLKPSIPALGEDGIPLRDELELELLL
jgi:GNAT superfamily N-acetyltransferase